MRAARLVFGSFLILAVFAAALFVFRLPLVGFAVKSAMARAGLESPKVEVVALSLNAITLRDVSAGPLHGEAFEIQEIEARYDWRALLSDRKVEAVKIGPGTVRIEISSEGRVLLPGVFLGSRDEEGGSLALPFSRLAFDDIVILIDTPLGAAHGVMSLDYDALKGGSTDFHLETDYAGFDAGRIENGVFDLGVDFSEDGAVMGAATFRGGLISPYGAVRDLDVVMTSEGSSWRDLGRGLANGLREDLIGHLRLEVRSALVSASDFPSTSLKITEQSAVLFGEPVSSLSFTGGMDLSLFDGVISVDIGGAPLIVDADNGAKLVIAGLPDDPLFRRSNDKAQANFSFSLSGARVVANGTLNAETTEDGWFVVTPVYVGEYRSENISFDDASALFRVTMRPGSVLADITTTTNLRSLSVGRLSVYDAPIEANFLIETDNAAKTALVTLPPSHCITLDDARITIAQQDTEAIFKGAKLCAQDRPLAIFDWSNDLRCDFAGNISASYLHYRLGKTNIVGRSPIIEVSGVYKPQVNQTIASGDVSGGALTFNDMLVFSSIDGEYDFSLDRQVMGAMMHVRSVRITQNENNPKVAPVIGTGDAHLVGKKATFDYVLETPTGNRLGEGVGVHNVDTARGKSTFVFDRLEFLPDGLQPELLAPVLKGVIGETTGAATGEATFTWAPLPVGLMSSANIQLDDITFGGPTRVITQTIGVNGRMDLANLWPVTTDGVQTISISGIDFGALQLEEGEIKFEMPGDETLRVIEANFPWFGGVLGVHDANASFAGGEATVHLQAENIDLALILEFADVEGLSGEGILSGVLPLVVVDGKASIENGILHSTTPGAFRYQGRAAGAASSAGEDAQLAFDLLRDLRFSNLGITIDGPLDGKLEFQLNFEGTGEVEVNEASGRVPVLYQINLEAAVLELLNQAALSRNIQLQVREGLQDDP